MHNQFVAENCTWLVAVDGDAQCFDYCSMAVDAVAADERHLDFAAVLHSVTQVGVERVLGG